MPKKTTEPRAALSPFTREGPAEPGERDEAPSFPLVGVGASAGGLDAFTQLLQALPPDTGMAFVLVQHLLPTHPSALAEILSRATRMPVTEVRDEPVIEPNHVYVIPPDRSMITAHGALQLLPREGGVPRPIDQFFRSLAADRQHQAIAVVLSGTATDGTLGLEAIKGEGGITFAQDGTAQHDGMPTSAIASGCVDFVLSPAGIARELVRIGRHLYAVPEAEARKTEDGQGLAPIAELLHEVTGVDFTHYKWSTLYRRITRRMVFRKVDSLAAYLAFLRQTPAETEALYQDILINVTSFFRDADAYEALKAEVFPRLVTGRSTHDPVRIWALGCSTGQEPYSLVMALTEVAEALGKPLSLQIFATDLNPVSIEKARAGRYSKDIDQHVSPERIRRFFVEEDGQYRICKTVRDACIFSRHNVLSDPPFSHLDLVSCRNLLIYLQPVLQQRVIPTLHYALKPGGCLWLGNSETIGAHPNLFDAVDGKHKIYRKKDGKRAAQGHFLMPPVGTTRAPFLPLPGRPSESMDLPREADRLLSSRFSPPGVLVSGDLEIIQFRGNTERYLAPAPGKASLNLLKMLREGLLVAVRAAVLRAGSAHAPVREEGLQVRSSDGYHPVSIEVIPVQSASGKEGGFLILFEAGADVGSVARAAVSERAPAGDAARLAQELVATREYLRSLIEQQEAANEELQSANEEVQSANEELQSSNEELETSKEEIQSSNEELTTVNDELRDRNHELSRANNDLVNLLGSIHTAIVMLGPDLRVRRFTPAAERLLNLIPADVGRPLLDIKHNLQDAPDLEALLREVLATVTTRERDVQDRQGRWFSMRLRPYRTVENVVDGVVLMLVDVDVMKRAHAYTESIIATMREPLLVLDDELRVQTASPAFYEVFGAQPGETVGRSLDAIGDGRWDLPELRDRLQKVLIEDARITDHEVERDCAPHGLRTMILNARRLVQPSAERPSILLAIEDITERSALEKRLKDQATELTTLHTRKDEFLAMLSHELRGPLAPIASAVRLLGMQGPSATQQHACGIIERQVAQLQHLVDDLLDVSRITTGRVQLRLRRVDAVVVAQLAIEAVQPFITQRTGPLTIALPDAPIWLDADAARLQQVLVNLLTNAFKYTNEDGSVGLSVARDGATCVLRVHDTGIGIDPALLPHIFDLFTQADDSLDRSRGGLGIGLALVKQIVELHQGAVEARSTLGKGSEIVVRLPVAPEGDPPLAKREIPQVRRASRPLRVLVVDDSADATLMLAMLLEALGHEVRTAADGVGALVAIAARRPDVVLLDIGLPGMSGYEVATTIRRDPTLEHVVLVALTGYGQASDRQRSREAGFDHHLVKPADFTVLKEILATVPMHAG